MTAVGNNVGYPDHLCRRAGNYLDVSVHARFPRQLLRFGSGFRGPAEARISADGEDLICSRHCGQHRRHHVSAGRGFCKHCQGLEIESAARNTLFH